MTGISPDLLKRGTVQPRAGGDPSTLLTTKVPTTWQDMYDENRVHTYLKPKT